MAPCDEATCAASANLNILKWLRENGCPWDKETCNSKNLEISQWAKDNGCPYDITQHDIYIPAIPPISP